MITEVKRHYYVSLLFFLYVSNPLSAFLIFIDKQKLLIKTIILLINPNGSTKKNVIEN